MREAAAYALAHIPGSVEQIPDRARREVTAALEQLKGKH
jgi:hypothetical protein